jgi:hypothetical protein
MQPTTMRPSLFLPTSPFFTRCIRCFSTRIQPNDAVASIQFAQWLLNNGLVTKLTTAMHNNNSQAKASDSEHSTKSGMGFGIKRSQHDWSVIATQPIYKGQTILKLPLELTIGIENSDEPIQPLLKYLPNNLWQLALGLKLLAETNSPNSASFYQPYIDTLPAQFPLIPLFYSPEDQAQLQYPTLLNQIKLRAKLLAQLAKKEEIRTAINEVASSSSQKVINEMAWAMSASSSRAFNFSAENSTADPLTSRRLLPLIDMLNHSFSHNCKIISLAEPTADNIQRFYLQLECSSDIDKGEELTINYGNLTNDNFLLNYGFICDENPFDTLELSLDLENFLLAAELIGIGIAQPIAAWKNKLIQESGIKEFTLGRALDNNLWAIIEILLAENNDSRQSLPFTSPEWLENHRKSPEIREKSKRILISYLGLLLQSFPTTIAEDLGVLQRSLEAQSSGNVNFTPKEMAVRFRIGKKRLLIEHINTLKG